MTKNQKCGIIYIWEKREKIPTTKYKLEGDNLASYVYEAIDSNGK